MISLCYDMT